MQIREVIPRQYETPTSVKLSILFDFTSTLSQNEYKEKKLIKV